MKHKILSLGEVLWDLFPGDVKFGGAPANFACHAALAGGDVAMFSAVGDDDFGRRARDILSGYGIDLEHLQTAVDAPTGTVGVDIDSAGKPTFTIHESSAWDQLAWTDSMETAIRSADLVAFGTLGQRSAVARETITRCLAVAQRADIPRIVDINLRAPFYDDDLIRQSIRAASILKLSDDELHVVAEAMGIDGPKPSSVLEDLLDASSLEFIVMTRGADGAVLVTPDSTIRQPGIATTVRDTVGAGDAFTARFVVDLLAKRELSAALKNACTHAAQICAIDGAVPDPG